MWQSSLLEREAEVAAIEQRVADACSGHGGLLVVEGPAGIGKTTLLAAVAEIARAHGMTVLSASAAPLEREFSFGVVREVFLPARQAMEAGQWAVMTSGAAALATPVLADTSTTTRGIAPGESGHTAVYGLYWLTANLAASRPLLVTIDDVQWADPASQRWLAYLARRLEGLAVLVVIAVRTGEPVATPDLLAEIVGEAAWAPMRPAPLGRDAVGHLVLGHLGPATSEEFCRACHQTTGGNPFLLSALLVTLAQEGVEPDDAEAARLADFGPDRVARAVDRQLARLPHGSRALVETVAILGSGALLRHVEALAELDPAETALIADALRDASILAVGRNLEFVHPIVRSAVITSMPQGRLALAHAHAARVLAADGAAADRLALHLLHAEPHGDQWIVETLRAAARLAFERGAPEGAERCLRRALEEPPSPQTRPAVVLELGLALIALRIPEASALLSEAVQLTTDPAQRAAFALEAVRALSVALRQEEVVEICRTVLDDPTVVDPVIRARLDAEMILSCWAQASTAPLAWQRVRRHSTESLGGTIAEALWLVNHAVAATFDTGPAIEAVGLLGQAIAAGAFSERDAFVVSVMVLMLIWNDEMTAAERICDLALGALRGQGPTNVAAHIGYHRGLIAYRRGALPDAEADLRPSYDFIREAGATTGHPFALATLVDVLIERDELAAAEREIATSGLAEPFPAELGGALLMESRGRLRCAAGRPAEGVADLLDAARRWEALGMVNPNVAEWRTAAAVGLFELGRETEAVDLAAEQLALARKSGLARSTGVALRTMGVVTGDLALLKEAIAVLEKAEAQLELARTLVDFGAALRLSGQSVKARDPLRRGLDLTHHCGALLLSRRAHEELRAAGARPRRLASTGVAALTASERRVACLAADGLSNREIAQQLFVTERTVETHLLHAFHKLDVHSRVDLRTELFAEKVR